MIAIKGVEMPKSCWECRFCVYKKYYKYDCFSCVVNNNQIKDANPFVLFKLKNCPLVEVEVK